MCEGFWKQGSNGPWPTPWTLSLSSRTWRWQPCGTTTCPTYCLLRCGPTSWSDAPAFPAATRNSRTPWGEPCRMVTPSRATPPNSSTSTPAEPSPAVWGEPIVQWRQSVWNVTSSSLSSCSGIPFVRKSCVVVATAWGWRSVFGCLSTLRMPVPCGSCLPVNTALFSEPEPSQLLLHVDLRWF